MFLDGQKLHPYIPMAKARGFTGAVDKYVVALEYNDTEISYQDLPKFPQESPCLQAWG